MTRKLMFLSIILLMEIATARAKTDPYVEPLDQDWGDLSNPASIWSPIATTAQMGRLGEYGDVDAFTLDIPAQQAFQFEVMVPVCGDHFKDFYPSAAIIGPGLDAPPDGALPFTLADGDGALIFSDKPVADAKRLMSPDNRLTDAPVYESTLRSVDIPEAGQYTLAIWEPDGNVGAYMMATGTQPDMFQDRPDAELEAAFDLLFSDRWLGQDCSAPLAVENCPATVGPAGDAQIPDGPERADVGDGFVLTGIIRDSDTCLPIADAKIAFWMANAEGVYDDSSEGVLSTNAQGRYRLESGIPGQYENVTPHIHLAVSAPGYGMIVTEFLFREAGIESGTVDVNLSPEA
ncbi:MAG: hypothetical protein K8I30_01365 [Anaerolineae bacterium]|nr:hypothetical protein [Anaerolineae bacterium]